MEGVVNKTRLRSSLRNAPTTPIVYHKSAQLEPSNSITLICSRFVVQFVLTRTDSTNFPDCLPIPLSISFFYFLVFRVKKKSDKAVSFFRTYPTGDGDEGS